MAETEMPDPPRQPLYLTLRNALADRLSRGDWRPGEAIPAELKLAAEMGVSPGTVRKAIDGLVAEGVLRRHQGRGTFVTEEAPAHAGFRFLRLVDAEGRRVTPEPVSDVIATVPAGAEAARRLGIGEKEKVVTVERVRALAGRPAILEWIAVPARLMPGLERETPLPNALYPFYQARWGVGVATAEDRLTASAADAAAAKTLGVAKGTPLLAAERVARDAAGRPVEWRRSRFLTEGLAYQVTLR